MNPDQYKVGTIFYFYFLFLFFLCTRAINVTRHFYSVVPQHGLDFYYQGLLTADLGNRISSLNQKLGKPCMMIITKL